MFLTKIVHDWKRKRGLFFSSLWGYFSVITKRLKIHFCLFSKKVIGRGPRHFWPRACSQGPNSVLKLFFFYKQCSSYRMRNIVYTLCAIRIRTRSKICFYQKIHNFYPIITKFWQKKVLMRNSFWQSFVMIG